MRIARRLPLALFLLLAATPLPAQAEPAQAALRWAQRLLSTLPTITGRVLTVDGRPVAGARVVSRCHPEREEPEPMMAEVNTDREGRFLLATVAGTHDLEITAPGFLPAEVHRIAISPDRSIAGLPVHLVRGAVLLGRVLDEAGAPVAGARVNLWGGASFTFGTTSDGAGRYRLDGIDPGERDVRFDLGEDRASFHQVRIVAGENRLDLTLVRQVVRGRVRNPEGEPVAGAWVRLSGTAGAHVAITGADGTFAFKTLAGWFRLDACKDGYVSFRSRPLRVGGTAAEGIEVRLSRGGTVRGRINGIPDGERSTTGVGAFNRETQESVNGSGVDAQGRYRIDPLGPGTWHVTAAAKDRWTAGDVTLKPGAGEARLDLTLPAAWPARGHVVDGDGAPVGGLRVGLYSGKAEEFFDQRDVIDEEREPDDAPRGIALSGADGAFSLELPDGVYEVYAAKDGYAPAVSTDPVTVEGAAVGGVEVRIAAGATLTGRVLGLTPAELAKSSVTASQENGATQLAWLDDRDGSYAIGNLGPGDWKVSANYGATSAVARLHLEPGELQATLDLTFVHGELTQDRDLKIELPPAPEEESPP